MPASLRLSSHGSDVEHDERQTECAAANTVAPMAQASHERFGSPCSCCFFSIMRNVPPVVSPVSTRNSQDPRHLADGRKRAGQRGHGPCEHEHNARAKRSGGAESVVLMPHVARMEEIPAKKAD